MRIYENGNQHNVQYKGGAFIFPLNFPCWVCALYEYIDREHLVCGGLKYMLVCCGDGTLFCANSMCFCTSQFFRTLFAHRKFTPAVLRARTLNSFLKTYTHVSMETRNKSCRISNFINIYFWFECAVVVYTHHHHIYCTHCIRRGHVGLGLINTAYIWMCVYSIVANRAKYLIKTIKLVRSSWNSCHLCGGALLCGPHTRTYMCNTRMYIYNKIHI